MIASTSSPPRKRSSWLRKLLFVFTGLLVLLVVAFFIVTSSAFFKGVILPRAGKAISGQITVADASLSPFSQVYLRQLRVQTTGTEPLLQADEVRLRYSLFSILGGTVKVDEVTVVSPIVQIIENADGTSNLDPLSKKEAKPASKPTSPSGKPPQIDLKNFTLKNATIRRVKNLKDGGREVVELTGINITLDQIKNGQAGKLASAAAFKLTRPTNDVVEGKIVGNVEFTMGDRLMPQVLQAKLEEEVSRAEGTLRDLAGHRVVLASDLTVNPKDKTALLKTLTLDGTQNQKQLLRGSLTQPMTFAWGNASTTAGDSTFDLTVTDFNFADWTALLGDSISAGRLSLNLKVLSQQGGKQLKLGFTSRIADLSMRLGATPLTQAELALKLNGQVNDLKKFNFSDYRLDLTRQSQPALTVSGSVNYDGAAFNLQTQIEAVMARLLGSGPATPLTVGVKLAGTFTNQVLDLGQLQLALTPTQRASKNEVNIAGHFDLSTPTTKGRLSINADTFDVTQLYDAFAGEKSPSTATAGAPVPPAPASSSPGNVEPDLVNLPLQFTADADLGQVYLHEIAITSWQTTAKVDGGKITLDPCRLTLNGAPVNANVDLNLGVKGYTYAVSLLMDKVPLEPIANTFSPANRGKYKGTILANAKIKGAGVTGASLQKSLSGQVSFSFTNANIQLMGAKTRKIVVPIATLLSVPEITESPLNWLDIQTELGGGNIKLTRCSMQSEAFEARTQGSIPIAEVLTNSPLNLPVEFAMRRSLAEKSSLMPANTPPDARYAMLPQFVTLKGTIGEPKSDLNKLALGGLLLKSGVGIAEKLGVNVGGKTGGALQGVGDLLTGQKSATTNQPGTNTAPKLNPLDLFKKK